MASWPRPTRDELAAAYGKRVPDVIAPKLKVLFCGISAAGGSARGGNPGLYSGAVGHHFARPGNRFWPALYRAGFTDRLLSPFEERELPQHGYGITNIVNRATAHAAELSGAQLRRGARRLAEQVRRFRPAVVAVLGVRAYRAAFARGPAQLGPQPETIAGARLWVLPNPSGRAAHYQLPELIALFRRLRRAVASAAKPLRTRPDKDARR